MLKLLLPLLPLLLGAIAAAPADSRTIYVVRHLNTPAGATDPDLTPEGHSNAERLKDWFAGRPLDAIISSEARRAQQTISPLAKAKGMVPRLYDPKDTAKLIAIAKERPGDILIVGHSNTVPDIVEGLGGERPADMPLEQLGDIWEISQGKSVRHSFVE